jgi:alpha-beta hydrolase superfamily lysophospholipase
MDFNLELKNGQVLKGIIRSPGENAKAVILMVHGIGEHIQRYNHWADRFLAENIAFAGVDLPCHGRSAGKRGKIRNYYILDEMIDVLLNTLNRTFPGIPVYIYGHSLGGGIVLYYILRKKPRIKGAIVTSPSLRLAFQPSKSKLTLAAIVKSIMPGLVQKSDLDASALSHDKAVVDAYHKDPLVHDKVSVGLYMGIMEGAAYSLLHAGELKLPTLLIHGNEDKICSYEATREFAAKTKMAELRIWEGGYHELHNEPFRDDVFKYIMNWINKRKNGAEDKDKR